MTKTGQYYGNDNYCWSHGYNVAKNHDSKSCKEEWRHTGHKEEANGDNPMKAPPRTDSSPSGEIDGVGSVKQIILRRKKRNQ